MTPAREAIESTDPERLKALHDEHPSTSADHATVRWEVAGNRRAPLALLRQIAASDRYENIRARATNTIARIFGGAA